MRNSYGKYGVLGVLVLALLLGLLLVAGPASATGTCVGYGSFLGFLDLGASTVVDGTEYIEDEVLYGKFSRVTGAEGWRIPDYLVLCLDAVVPPKGSHSHTGEVAMLREDPSSFWDASLSFEVNLADHALLWTGTWNGMTRNGYNHQANMTLVGVTGGVNDGYKADVRWQSTVIDPANYRSGHFIITPATAVFSITPITL